MSDIRPVWLQKLDKVRTTHQQARDIINRQRELHGVLDKMEPFLLKQERPPFIGSVGLGCPHCMVVGRQMKKCGQCDWYSYRPHVYQETNCYYADFGGTTLMEIEYQAPVYLHYGTSDAWIGIQYLDEFSLDVIKDCIATIRKFLNNHIEWGEDVLSRPDLAEDKTW